MRVYVDVSVCAADESELDSVSSIARAKKHEQLLRRMLNPEDLGFAIQPHVRDEVRAALGMPKVETK